MSRGPIEYFQKDERPEWAPTVILNGEVDDLSTGFTFVVLVRQGLSDPVITKTTGIVGDPAGNGRAVVFWDTDELDILPGAYRMVLTATRTSDGKDWTIEEKLIIKAR